MEPRAGQPAESRQSTRDARGSDEPGEGADPWGRKREARSHQGPGGRCTSSICPGRKQPRSPELRPEAGLYPGEPETCRRSLRLFLRNFIYLALLLAVFKVYRIEERAFQGRAFQMLVTLALAALPFHYLAPFRWKKPLFVAVSVGGLVLDLRPPGRRGRARAECDLDLGSASCPFPGSPARPASAAVALALACVRPVLPRNIIPDNVLPVIASMFMFRIIIYLYELKHAKSRETLVDTLSYFFLLPNFCFMHFPVVDYRTMQRGYFADDVHALQRRGLQMMFRGTIHLLLYRLVYHEMLIPASRVHDLASLSCYLVCNYLLVSRRFRASFTSPAACSTCMASSSRETHHNYLLATGFTDYWRRINIYWKDFMVRLFFNPVVFRLKRWPQPAALAVATVCGIPGHLALACLSVVLAAGELGFFGSRRSVLGNPGRDGAGECAA